MKWLTDDERQMWRDVTLMHLQLNAALARQLAGTELSLPDYMVLASLSDSPDPIRMTDLGRNLGWEKSRLSHHLTRMQRRGMVSRIKCPTDGRGWFVAMSNVGRRAIESAAPGHVAAVRRHFVDLLSPAEVADLGTVADKVLRHLSALPD